MARQPKQATGTAVMNYDEELARRQSMLSRRSQPEAVNSSR